MNTCPTCGADVSDPTIGVLTVMQWNGAQGINEHIASFDRLDCLKEWATRKE